MGLPARIVLRQIHMNADAPQPLRLLRTGSDRNCGRTAEHPDELAPSHCLPPRLRTRHRSGSNLHRERPRPCPLIVKRQTFAPQKVMSALPPKADMCAATRDVRFGPIADIARG